MLQTACLRPFTPDTLPILGPVPGHHNVFVSTGGGRKGILLGPWMGRAVAELVLHGRTSINIASLAVERFLPG